uniref:Uncharacterized protein n=1 Tax=Ditylenchus dipsaci TaxID=166011 RepID=A0A915DGH1_9BILA
MLDSCRKLVVTSAIGPAKRRLTQEQENDNLPQALMLQSLKRLQRVHPRLTTQKPIILTIKISPPQEYSELGLLQPLNECSLQFSCRPALSRALCFCPTVNCSENCCLVLDDILH